MCVDLAACFRVAYLRNIYIYLYVPVHNPTKPVLPQARAVRASAQGNADAADIYRPFSIARSPRTGAAEALKSPAGINLQFFPALPRRRARVKKRIMGSGPNGCFTPRTYQHVNLGVAGIVLYPIALLWSFVGTQYIADEYFSVALDGIVELYHIDPDGFAQRRNGAFSRGLVSESSLAAMACERYAIGATRHFHIPTQSRAPRSSPSGHRSRSSSAASRASSSRAAATVVPSRLGLPSVALYLISSSSSRRVPS